MQVQQKDIPTINIYASNHKAPKFIKQKTDRIEGKVGNQP